MLLTEKVELKWNSKIKKHYVNLGYHYTKMKDPFIVNVSDLTKGSSAQVELKCDYCGDTYFATYERYLKSRINVQKDACRKPECTGAKAQEALKAKYGVNSMWDVDEIVAKRKATNLKKYGSENPFGSKEIIEKIKQHNLENYGVTSSMQRPDVLQKSRETCMQKYGVPNYGKLYSETHCKELSPTWKGGTSYHRVERSTYEYRQWRKAVFVRDKFTCTCCGARNYKGLGKTVRLEAHHIDDWKNNVDKRYDVDNGATLCQDCHIKFHSLFGKHGNNYEQLVDFYKQYIDEKIC